METVAHPETSQAAQIQYPTHGDRLTRSGGWLALAIALLMLGSVAEAVFAARWSDGLEVVRLAIMCGGLIGFALALTRFDGAFAFVYGVLAGLFWVVVSLHRVLLPDLGTHEAVQELLVRNTGWLLVLARGGAGADNLVFVTQLGLLGWWLGFFATWNLFRHQRVLLAAVPLGLALIINLYYSPINLSGYLLVFLIAVVFLALRVELANNESRWQISRIRYAPDIFVDFLKAGVAFTIIAVLISWAMPTVATRANLERLLRPFEQPWKSVEDTWSRMYQSINYPGVAPVAPRYGKSLTLGGPVDLGDRPILEAQFADRTYWRAVTYDQYDGRGWTNTDQEGSIIEAGQWLGEPLFAATTEMTATLRPLEAGQDVILAPPQPLRLSLPVDADISRITEDGASVSVSRMRSRVELNPRFAYRVVSAVTRAPVTMLQADEGPQPAWVAERYLALPDTVPARVLQLAGEITAPYDNAYDKAAAIESYLRSFPYDTGIEAPPEAMDAVDYFLFDVKRGYCDYYASAMVIMLRAAGVPSRLAAGYAPGELLLAQDDRPTLIDTYKVVERDAHAWVEVFFPTYGWIQFEPTASQPMVQRVVAPQVSVPLPTPTPLLQDGEDLRDLRNLGSADSEPVPPSSTAGLVEWLRKRWIALATAAAIAVLIALTVLGVKRRQATLLGSPTLLNRLYGQLGGWALRLRIPWPASNTPLEHASQFGRRVPEAEPLAVQMATLFVAQRFGRQSPPPEMLQDVAKEWLNLEPMLWKRWLKALVHLHPTHPSGTSAPVERSQQHSGPDRDRLPGTSQRR